MAVHGNRAHVQIADEVVLCHTMRNGAPVVAGDEVCVAGQIDQAYIEEVLPRSSSLHRGLENGKRKLIAANLTHMAIVTAPTVVFSEYLIDCYLCACWLQKLTPLLIINKIDLMAPSDWDVFSERLRPYRELRVELFLTSVLTQQGLSELSEKLQSSKSVFVGVSGVGKTSLTAYMSNQSLRTQPVLKTGSGKHTTTTASLYWFSKQGFLIDSPGVREFNLWPVSEEELQIGFPEFKPYLTGCRFRDCRHQAEPDCTLKQALQQGKISESRYRSYHQLHQHIVQEKKS